ncbi:MAG: hypothetical protein MUF27_01975 [Acidobacteria bacterium]|nr:hypothetical protein [Acidobacteriota bacterium]
MSAAVRLDQLDALESWGFAEPLAAAADVQAPQPDEVVAALELARAVRAMLRELPAERRRLLLAVDYYGASERDVAAALGWSRGRVRRQLAEARAAFRVGLAAAKS